MAELTSRDLKRFDLEQGLTFEFFASHISGGGELSQMVVEKINFENGSFFTLLPDNSLEGDLYHFESSILAYGNYSTTSELYSYIFDFLHQKNHRYVVVDNLMADLHTPYADIKNVSILDGVKEVCYILNEKNSFEEVKEAVYMTLQLWHSLILFIQMDQETDEKNINIDLLLQNIQMVIVEAYDGEGFVFWERNDRIKL